MLSTFQTQGYRGFAAGLLLFGVYAYALSLLWGRGTYEPALAVCGLAVCLRLMDGAIWPRIGEPLAYTAGIAGLFLIPGVLMANRVIAGDFHWALMSTMIAVIAISLLPPYVTERLDHKDMVIMLMLAFVCVQLEGNAWAMQKNPVGKAGVFKTIHYLAQFAVMALPVLFYLALETSGRVRALVVMALIAVLWLLLQTHSRPGYMALVASVVVVLPMLSRRLSLIGFAALVVVLGGLYASQLFEFSSRINDFVSHFDQEERLVIWQEFMRLQESSSLSQWLFGHGLGQFFWDYQTVSSFHVLKEDFSSPHNYLLELLYTSGLFGCILFIFTYALWFWGLVVATRACQRVSDRRYGMMLVSVCMAQLVIGFFTIPFFSRHNLHPLSLILGASLIFMMEERTHA